VACSLFLQLQVLHRSIHANQQDYQHAAAGKDWTLSLTCSSYPHYCMQKKE
jgi:hypothetical protein